LIVFVLRISLPESPRWLAANRRSAEAFEILKRIGLTATRPLEDTVKTEIDLPDPLWDVLRNHTRRVVVVMISLFAAFAALYGLVTWLPTLMGAQGFNVVKSLKFTLVMTCAFPISSLVLILFVDRIGRVAMTVGSFVLAGISAMIFRSVTGESSILLVGFFMSFFVINAANTIEILCGELFPTNARSSGSGLGFGAGRLGAMLAAYFVPVIVTFYGTGGVYVAIAAVLALGAVSMLLLGVEPAKLSLEEIAPTKHQE
jgi:MFS transporter, putative metabolite:H+ symporter